MTGPIAHIGKDTEYGAQIAVDELNGEGFTLGGKPVKFQLVSEDDQGDPKMATQIAQRMVDAKIAGMIGHLNSGTTIPASKICRRQYWPNHPVGHQPGIYPRF